MFQYIIIALLFIGSCLWLGRLVWRSFTSKSCENGCGSCAIDWNEIEKKAKAEIK